MVSACLGCDKQQPSYYIHLATGQLRILLGCKSIPELLSRPQGLDGRTRQQLQLIGELRRYARLRLGLEVGSNYTCFYDTGGEPVSWNVSASPPDRFEPYRWRYPIIGTLPYKGFFDSRLARTERDSLDARGYDVLMRSISAYSTLGYFSDPVLSTMIHYREEALADLIFHELTHATVFVDGHADFNENLASFVGKTGSLQFLADRYGDGSVQMGETVSRRRDASLFRKFLFGLTARLDSLYSSGSSRAEVLEGRLILFEQGQRRFGHTRTLFDDIGRYDHFRDWEINNAQLLSYRRYHNLDIFEQRFAEEGRSLRAVVSAAVACVDGDDPWTCFSPPSNDRAAKLP